MSMLQVAKLAGVSTATVSRCFGRREGVSPDTSANVRRAAATLQFEPRRRVGSSRGSMAVGRTIGLFAVGVDGADQQGFFGRLLRGIADAVSDAGLNLSLRFFSRRSIVSPSSLEPGLAGVLWCGEEPSESLAERLCARPAVWLRGDRSARAWGDRVGPNDEAIGIAAARYLLTLGHRRLACLSAASDRATRLRQHAFRVTAEDAGANVIQASASSCRDALSQSTGLFVDGVGSQVDAAAGHADVVEFVDGSPTRSRLEVSARIEVRPESIGQRGVEQLLLRLRGAEDHGRVRVLVEPTLVELDRSQQIKGEGIAVTWPFGMSAASVV